MQVFVQWPNSKTECLWLKHDALVSDLCRIIGHDVEYNSRILNPKLKLKEKFVQVKGRLLGGKGGFGSMLRAQGGRMSSEKSTNVDACRDLNGQRIRAIKQANLLIQMENKKQKPKKKVLVTSEQVAASEITKAVSDLSTGSKAKESLSESQIILKNSRQKRKHDEEYSMENNKFKEEIRKATQSAFKKIKINSLTGN